MILPSPRALRLAGVLAVLSLGGAAWAPLGWLCAGGIAALALGVLLEGRTLPSSALALRREAPPRLSLGEPEPVSELLDNLRDEDLEVRFRETPPAGVALSLETSEVLRVPARGSAVFRFSVTASGRGEFRLPRPVVCLGRPGGWAQRQGAVGEPALLRVYPNVRRLGRYERLRQNRTLSALGIHRARHSGLGSEFDHLRAYSRDDDFRRIHWKATARRGAPITQVVQVERGQSVILAVDASHWMGISAGGLSRLDFAVDASLFLAHVAQRSGDRVGLVVFAHETVRFLPPSSRPGQTRRILDALYAVRPERVHPSYRNLARNLLERRLPRALVVVLTEPPDAESSKELVRALGAMRRRHLPLAVGFRDPALAEEAGAVPADRTGLLRRLAARELVEEREQRIRDYRRRGLQTLDVLPAELSVSLVNRYLELKRRGVLG